jgi:membrane-bound lytic murein transglycosylase D
MKTNRIQFISSIPIFIITASLGGWFLINLFSGAQNPWQDNIIENQPDTIFYGVKQAALPESLSFAGENVPLQLFDVAEALDNETTINTFWHSSTILIIKRAKRYFPVIEPILKANNIPDDFKYLCVIESGLKNVTSPAGAKGFWQFLNTTGKEYGLEINSYVDERYNLEKSTIAACKYIQNAYDNFGSWTMAAAAYNMGNNGLLKVVNHQKVNNYYDLHLNSETARYVYRILAMKLIMENHHKYGFNIPESDKYLPIQSTEIMIDTSINDLVDFAFQNGTNYKLLKQLNPWLTNRFLINNSGKQYKIALPASDYRPFEIPEGNKQ